MCDSLFENFFQGVDLSNIVTDGPGEGDKSHTLVITLQNLSKQLEKEVNLMKHNFSRKVSHKCTDNFRKWKMMK